MSIIAIVTYTANNIKVLVELLFAGSLCSFIASSALYVSVEDDRKDVRSLLSPSGSRRAQLIFTLQTRHVTSCFIVVSLPDEVTQQQDLSSVYEMCHTLIMN